MTARPYLDRVADAELARRLSANGAVLIEGPKACGKTETARRQAASEVLLDIDLAAQEAASIDAGLILDGAAPRLIDEWQAVPAVWNRVRREVDVRGEAGQFILTGSATPADDLTRHTGAMRFGRVRMRPMTLFEAGVSAGAMSLARMLAGEPLSSPDSGLTLPDLIEETVRGGWPATRTLDLPDAAQAVRDYLQQITRTDIHAVDGIRRDPVRVEAVVRSLARNTATQATLSTLASDVAAAGGSTASYETAGAYLTALERLMIVENVPAWNPHLRSSHQLRTSPTRHFVDPSVAVAALRATPDALRRDLQAFGLLFESLVVRDLRVYGQPLGAEVFHYRDQSGLEVDAVVDTGEKWGAFEVKLGGAARIDEAALSLATFMNRIDLTRRPAPSFLAVIVATGYGYTRPDGVRVVPIGSLGP